MDQVLCWLDVGQAIFVYMHISASPQGGRAAGARGRDDHVSSGQSRLGGRP